LNPRLKRQLLTAVISGALVATGAVAAAPANAASPVSAVGPVLADDPTTTPTVTDPTTDAPTTPATTEPTTEPTTAPTTTAATTAPTTAPTTTAATTAPTTTPATTTPTTVPPTKVDKAPTGSFRLNSFSLWIGQSVTVTQLNIADDGVKDPANVSRLIKWGDGTSTRIYKGWGAVGHRYTRAARYPISLTLADPAGHQTVLKTVGPLVSVPAARYKLSTFSVWPGQVFSMTIFNVPAGTTKITIDEGDGYAVNLPGRNQTFRLYYYHRKTGQLVRGPVTIRAAFTNKFGTSSWLYAARPTVKTDSWTPVVKVTKPSGSNKASSWKTVKGTVTDKGSGAPYVYVWVAEQVGSKYYCFNKGWHVITSDAAYYKYCYYGIPVKNVKGKWSLKVGGVKKGTFYVDARTQDWADRISKWASIKVKITK
jgi:hypothetical protein